jgi:hypothetical protein
MIQTQPSCCSKPEKAPRMLPRSAARWYLKVYADGCIGDANDINGRDDWTLLLDQPAF